MKCVFQKILLIITVTAALTVVNCENKYSRSANEKKKNDVDFRKLEKPFRMNKLNLLWVKAQQRLTEPKLKSLYSELTIQDKEEITLKRVKSEGGDKEGFKEAELRRKLSRVMENYGLREHFDAQAPPRHKDHPTFNSASEDHINKSLFKDKKLNMLWSKAEASGFTSEELAALREEFAHHQDKIDQYYELLSDIDAAKKDEYQNAINEDEMEEFNEIDQKSLLETNEVNDKDFINKANLVRDKHKVVRDGYDRLQRITARGPNNKEFIEPKVQGLWRMATAANFTVEELASLKVELHHYENRLLKLRNLHADHVSSLENHNKKLAATGDKLDHIDHTQQLIKKQSQKVDKMHFDLENKIKAKHTEL